MNIVLFGKFGMLGSAFYEFLSQRDDLDLIALDKEEVDLCDETALNDFFTVLHPDFVINCAAFTLVDDCESNKDSAMNLNGKAPAYLAKICSEKACKLIHFSTDYVFDGEKTEGYLENDSPSPINVYGKSKLAGEHSIIKNCDNYYIIRTSWLFGPNGKNFVKTMLELSSKNDFLNVVGDQFGSPTYTQDLARTVISEFITKSPEYGIYHLTNSGSVSWFEFAGEIFRIKKINLSINRVTSDEFPSPAKRPRYSILLNSKLDMMRPWQAALRDYLSKNDIT